ncbi:hypothetical protein [aff. Roholtiella sp. LEGE 12411]|uniref:hypothetical protein n=1 Tax=aff. Roholtiella sp. LEGE 12411 TaxID=1828822 RepID=UPI00187F390E|nr:hypothetical protein [aff. Roholtiella sp. LEGE 12411]MBE9037185.1 hypothetical protein [aff. Roholtiella sp. LEGE 12411]
MLPNEFNNKIRAVLPHKSHYKALGINASNKFVYQDCKSQMLRIVSPETEPWNKEWDILLSFQRKKSDQVEYDSRLDLKLFYPEDNSLIKAKIVRDLIRADYPRSDIITLRFAAFPSEPVNYKFWVIYSFVEST